ncbi:MAG: oxidoreductase [Actinomycetota bacterium]|nr:oxidoreductase [Actinomycetota bacterium]
MSSSAWTVADIPDLTGKRALVTGVTSGLGKHTTLELARHGAEVLMTARTESKLRASVETLRRTLPNASVVPVVLDLADLSSVRRAAEEAASYGALDILVNNAGVMATPKAHTVDGFELQFGTNHLGHFALTGLLLPQLSASDGARVVTVSSQAHRLVRSVPLTDPRDGSRRYQRWVAYGESKLANLLFAFELDRRARRAELPLVSTAAHPGYAATNLVSNGPRRGVFKPVGAIMEGVTRLMAQPSSQGVLPQLMAATMAELPGATYVGPGGPAESRGAPVVVGAAKPAHDEQMAARLWEVSELATGVTFL